MRLSGGSRRAVAGSFRKRSWWCCGQNNVVADAFPVAAFRGRAGIVSRRRR